MVDPGGAGMHTLSTSISSFSCIFGDNWPNDRLAPPPPILEILDPALSPVVVPPQACHHSRPICLREIGTLANQTRTSHSHRFSAPYLPSNIIEVTQSTTICFIGLSSQLVNPERRCMPWEGLQFDIPLFPCDKHTKF